MVCASIKSPFALFGGRHATLTRGTVIYNVALIGMCRCEGYGFQAVWSGIRYRNKGGFFQHRIGHQLPEN